MHCSAGIINDCTYQNINRSSISISKLNRIPCSSYKICRSRRLLLVTFPQLHYVTLTHQYRLWFELQIFVHLWPNSTTDFNSML
ncbi:hypothetical protein MKW98_015418 [Papaver atlanticum]|uniref:Uncharacterized protein n=1 Tax=Papaver atlanticum TaxID=357466 RepID=A0AAD4X4P3_9MAGN|nr:hypothetical protein MKW98_015418 [Papaver atlanticum]